VENGVKQIALQKAEFLNIMPSSWRSSRQGIGVDVFVLQLNFAERSGCWSRLQDGAFRHGSHFVAEKDYLAGKATTFSPPGRAWRRFNLSS
jgi:hypothetical protein